MASELLKKMKQNRYMSLYSFLDNKEKIVVTDIDWDAPKDVDLPREVVIVMNENNKYLLNDIDGFAPEVAEYLSDTYGFCVFAYCISLE